MLARTRTRFHEVRRRLEDHVASSRASAFLWELFLFVFKQAWACLFGGLILFLILLTRFFWPPRAPIARYDLLFLAALALQLLLLLFRLETVREAKVILLFHVVGTVMELFKTHVGSWTYPESNLLRLGQVPLFSGFMYASVGSYLARATRINDLRYTHFPRRGLTILLAGLIYLNFFTHHFLPDARILLLLSVGLAFGRTVVYFRPYRKFRRMPMLLAFLLIASFIWAAENIATFSGIWIYPEQKHGWHLVSAGKLGAWLLLMIISFILVSLVSPPRLPRASELDRR